MLPLGDNLLTRKSMDFRQFLSWSEDARLSAPEAERYCETRIARALSHLVPIVTDSATSPRVHRCDLVRLWCDARGVCASAQTTLASEGVRHSLRVIFKVLARIGATVAMPTDVYPVYSKIAAESELSTVGFPTFPTFDIDRILNVAQAGGAHHVLLPQPLKLHGRVWTEDETAIAEAWLRADDRRRLLIDGVYGLGRPLDSVSKRLIDTEQVVFLDSLSKGWLHEQVFGVTLIPEQDVRLYASPFRDLSPAPPKLFVANELLRRFLDVPRQIERELDARREKLLGSVSRTGCQSLPSERGYLVAVAFSCEQLLRHHAILAIPASAFGSRLTEWSIASALPTADHLL
jgi:aspartate/methionine/tyrosine aminotransferase